MMPPTTPSTTSNTNLPYPMPPDAPTPPQIDPNSISGTGANPFQQLQVNLTSLFAKDNPLIPLQQGAAQDYFNTLGNVATQFQPSASNPANVNGIPLAMSPAAVMEMANTERNAQLARLGGINSLVTSMYGTIPQMVQNEKDYMQMQQEREIAAAQLALQKQEFNFNRLQLPSDLENQASSNEAAARFAQQAQNILSKPDFKSSMLPDFLKQTIAEQGPSSILWGLLSPDEQALATQYNSLAALGVHNLSARTSSSAMDALSSGFASLGKNNKLNSSLLDELINNAKFETQNIAGARLLPSSAVPGYSTTFGSPSNNWVVIQP